MYYYDHTDSSPNGAITGKLFQSSRINTDSSEDILSTYTYITDINSPAYGEIYSVTTPTGTTTYSYDSNGLLSTITLPDNNNSGLSISYQYDSFGRTTQITDQNGSVTTITYDDEDRILTTTTPPAYNGGPSFVTTYVYDQVEPASTFNIDYNFDGNSDPLIKSTTIDQNNRASARYSDPSGKTWVISDAQNNITRYGYNDRGSLSTITDANQNATNFAYDGRDRLTTVTDPYNKTTTYGYYPNSNLKFRTDAKAQSISYGYDNINRMVTKCFGSNGGTCTSNKIAFTYNGDQIASVTDSYHKIGTSNQAYTYG